MKLKIFTDGACSGNQNEENYGGWGAVLRLDLQDNVHEKEIYGGEPDTTNNRMELTGVIEAFSALKKPDQDIEVYTDSAYIVNCFKNRWYVNWQKNGWKNASGKPVENRDLWEKLLSLVESHNVKFVKVKGHVSLRSSEEMWGKHYRKFLKESGFSQDEVSIADFKAITEMNVRVDALAVRGACEAKTQKI
ncbi:MAG: ribonuclease HI [Clostridiales bacterium]|nr:ribonuclease HI [Clostridiales bacterium]MDD7347808.1 ribonuclease HI [Clostridiales bacterium]MDY4060003.1 ribonuclease H [Anaerovoracaceae bacterium]